MQNTNWPLSEYLESMSLLAAVLQNGIESAHVTLNVHGPVCSENIADGFAKVEDEIIRVYLVARNSEDCVKSDPFCDDIMSTDSRPEFLRQGFLGGIWGAVVLASPDVPSGTILIVGEKESLFPNGTEKPLHPGGLVILKQPTVH